VFTLKNNNFDIIKDKFDRVEPEIPYSMDSKFIKEMILNKQKHKIIIPTFMIIKGIIGALLAPLSE
jgi:hypothetical protein